MPFDYYCLIPAVNSSKLKNFHGATPAHARAAMLEDKATGAKALGHAIHLALLEPARFEAETLVVPKQDKRSKAGKAAWAKFEADAKRTNRNLLVEEDKKIIDGIRASLSHSETALALLTNKGVNELTLVWDDESLGDGVKVRSKGRLDRYTSLEGWPIAVDVKSMGSAASRHDWERDAYKFGYWFQAPFYLSGLEALLPLPAESDAYRRFMWIVCETVPPFGVRVFEADEEPLQWGKDQYEKALRQYHKAASTGDWPGWDSGVELAGLPGWVYKTFPEEG
jgi:hypothetical protein